MHYLVQEAYVEQVSIPEMAKDLIEYAGVSRDVNVILFMLYDIREEISLRAKKAIAEIVIDGDPFKNLQPTF